MLKARGFIPEVSVKSIKEDDLSNVLLHRGHEVLPVGLPFKFWSWKAVEWQMGQVKSKVVGVEVEGCVAVVVSSTAEQVIASFRRCVFILAGLKMRV